MGTLAQGRRPEMVEGASGGASSPADFISVDQALNLAELCKEYLVSADELCRVASQTAGKDISSIGLFPANFYQRAKKYIERARK